jgi:PAS domain S-box-containing protein
MTVASVEAAGLLTAVPPDTEQLSWHPFMAALPVGIYTCDATGRVVRYNELAAELWGRSPDLAEHHAYCGAYRTYGLDGKPLGPADSPMAELLATGKALRARELCLERPDGSRIVVEANLNPLLDGAGQMIGGVSCFHDITGRKQAEHSLQQILQAMPVAVYTTDTSGTLTFFNEASAELWGWRPEIGVSQWCGSWRLRHLDGEPMAHDQCPMATALREEREIRWGRAVAERPDGTLVPFVAFPTPLHDAAGSLVGAVNTLLDVSEQQQAADIGMHMAAIVESSLDAIVSKDLNGIITSWNPAAERLFGYTADEAVGQSVLMLIPEGRQDEETTIIERIRRGERVDTFETMRRRKDGTLIPVSLTISPVRNARGRIVGASKIARDITSHKESERRIRVLMREVNHRVKNQYSVILAMIRESGKRSSDPAGFELQVRERIMALADSHDLLVSADWSGATVCELLRAQVKPFADSERITLSGPPLLLHPNAVQYLGIAFHELATNATKHGALSVKGGRIVVDWQIVPGDDGTDYLELAWREEGGPPATPAERTGFGSVVLQRITPQALNGSSEVLYGDSGITWWLRAPLDSVVARDDGDA